MSIDLNNQFPQYEEPCSGLDWILNCGAGDMINIVIVAMCILLFMAINNNNRPL